LSSKPEPIVELVLSNDWCKQFEDELKVLDPKLDYETVMYILRRLDKDPEKAFNFFNWVTERPGFSPRVTVYSLMLRILANKNSMKQFWSTLTKMKELGFYLDDGTYQTILGVFKYSKMDSDATALKYFYRKMIKSIAMDDVVKAVANDVTESDWGNEVEKKLDEMNIIFSDNFVVRLLKELRQHPLKALHVFRWIGKSSSYHHNAVTYNAITLVLGQYDSIVEFWAMVDEMKNSGYEMDLDTYLKISRRFQRCRRLNDAVALYEHMMNSPYKPSVEDCGVLLRTIAANQNPELDLVFKVVKIFEAEGNVLSKNIYDAIHRSLTSVGRFDEAEKIIEKMREAGYEPDNITYSQLIFGLCKAGNLEEASKTIDVMEAIGCDADIKTWTILIQGYCRAKQVGNAILHFGKMMEKDCEADGDLLDVLVHGFYAENRVTGAYKLLIEMVKQARLRPWQATYKTMIDKLLDERKLEEAMEILGLMKKHNYPVFGEPFVKFISRHGTVEDALEFLKALSNKEFPSLGAYQHVFKSFIEEGRHSEAKDLLHKCPHHIRKHQAIYTLFGSSANINESAAVA
jgi:pentatricopeptide repeat protein